MEFMVTPVGRFKLLKPLAGTLADVTANLPDVALPVASSCRACVPAYPFWMTATSSAGVSDVVLPTLTEFPPSVIVIVPVELAPIKLPLVTLLPAFVLLIVTPVPADRVPAEPPATVTVPLTRKETGEIDAVSDLDPAA